MNINNEYPVMIFRKDNDYGTFYKVGLTKKDLEGKYINGYKDIRFKKGVELENQTKIYIKKAWLDFYTKDNKTIDYIFCSDFATVEEQIEESKQEVKKEKDLYQEFAEETELSDLDLPF